MAEKYAPQKKWKKANVKIFSLELPIKEAEEFAWACEKLGLKRTTILRAYIRQIIDKAKALDAE